MIERLYDLSLCTFSSCFCTLLNIHRCFINTCLYILKSCRRFSKTETFNVDFPSQLINHLKMTSFFNFSPCCLGFLSIIHFYIYIYIYICVCVCVCVCVTFLVFIGLQSLKMKVEILLIKFK